MASLPAQPQGARLALRTLGLASCFRVGLIAGAGAGVVISLGVFVLWQVVTPAVLQAVSTAFAGSKSLLAGVLGVGPGLGVAALCGLVAGLLVVLTSVLLPLYYGLVARRTGGVAIVLSPGDRRASQVRSRGASSSEE